MQQGIDGLADSFKALGDPVRLRLFRLIASADEICVCHMSDALELPQSTVSRHLAVLRHAGLVSTRRDGKWMHYRISGPLAATVARIANEQASDLLAEDRRRLDRVLADCP